jgi:nucleotide-binding universal stress UspA family protein
VVPGTDARDAQAHVIAAAEQYLAGVAEKLRTRGFTVETATPYGESAAAWIIKEAAMRHADLIAMTTHGRSGPGRWLFGSVAERVVASSPVPVMVDRGWLPQHRELLLANTPRILVALDGSEFAETALGVAAGLADDTGGELILFQVGMYPEATFPNDYAGLSEIRGHQKLVRLRRSAMLDYLNSVADRLADLAPSVTARVEERIGQPVDEIVNAARTFDAALVVMATHGRTGLPRAVMGSVGGAVLESGTTPLVLVNPASLAQRFRLPDAVSASL